MNDKGHNWFFSTSVVHNISTLSFNYFNTEDELIYQIINQVNISYPMLIR